MGRKKHNLCSGCGLRHAAPTGKACTAGVGMQVQQNGDKFILRGQGPNQEGLDALDVVQRRQNAVSIKDRVSKMENEVGLIDAKLDLVLDAMKKGYSRAKAESEDYEVMGAWTEEITEAWQDVKGRG